MRISDWSSDVCSSDLEDARRQQFGDAKPHRKDHPQPPRFADECAQVHWVSGSNGPRLRGAGAGGDVGGWVPSAYLAGSPITPSVPMNCVDSTGHRFVLALGEVANLPIAATDFCATQY